MVGIEGALEDHSEGKIRGKEEIIWMYGTYKMTTELDWS